MSKHVDFTPEGVCSKSINFNLDDDNKIHGLNFVGGCPGNLKAITKLLEGADAEKTAKLLRGNLCGTRGTSCVDQLAIAIEGALSL